MSETPKRSVDLEDVSARGLNAVMIMALGGLIALVGVLALSDGFRTAIAAYTSLPEPAKRKLDFMLSGILLLVMGVRVGWYGSKQFPRSAPKPTARPPSRVEKR